MLVGLSSVVQWDSEGDDEVFEEESSGGLGEGDADDADDAGVGIGWELDDLEAAPLLTGAPEQLREEPVSPETDVYVFCGGLYQLLTGEAPFAAETREGLLAAMERQDYVRPQDRDPRVTPRLAEVIERGLLFDPRARWPTLAEPVRLLAGELDADQFADAGVELREFYAKPVESGSDVAVAGSGGAGDPGVRARRGVGRAGLERGGVRACPGVE